MQQRTNTTTLDTAHAYARRGWRVIPVYNVNADGTCACGVTDIRDGVDKHAAGKHPIGARWQERASSSGADVQEWFSVGHQNIGIATGEASGIFVLDVDPDNGGDKTLWDLQFKHGDLPSTWAVRTGSGGEHYYFAWPGFDLSNSAGLLGPGLDIRGNGGQVVAPPSVSAKGAYITLNEVDVAPAPEWLLSLLTAEPAPRNDAAVARLAEAPEGYVQTAVEYELRTLAATTEGSRNHALNRAAFAIATLLPHGVITEDEIITAFTPVALDLGLDASETRKTIASAIAAGMEKPRPWPPEDRATATFIPFAEDSGVWPMRTWDDFGNASRLIDHHPGRLLWIEQAEKWAVYEDTRWQLDTKRTAQSFAQETIDSLPKTEALTYSDLDGIEPDEKGKGGADSTREVFLSWVKSQRHAGKVKAMLETVRGVRGMSADITDFDADPMLLNARNGVLNMLTGEVAPHTAELMQMQQVNASVDPAATCPRWEAFLEKMQPHAEVRDYIQRVIGYSLTGDISEQKMFMHLGEGANGKSVMLEVMTGLLGSYSQAIPRTTLIVTRNDGIPNDVARMVGKRFLQTSETGKGRVLDEEAVKGLTGGEEQSARFMRAEFFDFRPTGKIHYVTNHFPRVSDAPSLWRRLSIIKWQVTIADDDPERDRQLAAKIIAEEMDGVLAWAVRGLQQWRLLGLAEPEIVRAWGTEYRDDADEFGDFIAECLMTSPDMPFIPTQRLYEAYSGWVFRGGRGPAMSVKAFSHAMKERGHDSIRSRDESGRQMRGFVGVGVRVTEHQSL